ncbi:hypothetical protein CPC08DRAFT_755727 [Agrocybe pediades]|nr:hypothetical protein CPC08DRAFT_755727 [Agrocybe pediades]
MPTTSSPSSRLPFELYEEIIDCLYDHPPALRSCALICRSFVLKSQRYLFCNVDLSTDPEHQYGHPSFADGHRFRTILEGSPHLASYVLNLRITSNSQVLRRKAAVESEGDSSFARKRRLEEAVIYCLLQFHHLRCLSVDTRYRSSTCTNPEFLAALKDAVTLPSLVCLDQSSMLALLFMQRNLLPYLSLCIGEAGLVAIPENPSPEQRRNRCRVEFLRITQAKMAMASYLNNYLVGLLNIENLQCLYVTAEGIPYHYYNIMELLRACGQNLKELIFHVELRGYSDSALDILSFQELQSLRTLQIRLVAAKMNSRLLRLVDLVRSLPTGPASHLEQLSIHASYLDIDSTESIFAPWEEIHSLVVDPDYFPRLKDLEFMALFSRAYGNSVQSDVAAWQTHFREKKWFSSRLEFRADIFKNAPAKTGSVHLITVTTVFESCTWTVVYRPFSARTTVIIEAGFWPTSSGGPERDSSLPATSQPVLKISN